MPTQMNVAVEELFPPTNRFRIFGEKIYPVVAQSRPTLAAQAYCPDNGREAVEPVLLMGVSVLQFMERVPDRQAQELTRYHLGWNLALRATPGQVEFHPTTLVYFRERMMAHEQSPLLFEQVVQALVEEGLVARRSARRLDSSHIWGLVSQMSRLECTRETLRLALQELAEGPEERRPGFWGELWRRYVEGKDFDYRVDKKVLRARMDEAGADMLRLLHWAEALRETRAMEGPQMQLLKRVLGEQFELPGSGAPVQRAAQPPGAVHNPHDPDAHWARKGKQEHVGYKVQVAETVSQGPLEPGEPTRNFITAIIAQPATASDEAGMELVEAEQARLGLEPASALYVDGSYVSAGKLVQAQRQGQQLIGPAQPAPSRDGRFSTEAFKVEVEKRRATCPAGKKSTQCSRLTEKKTGRVQYRFEWGAHCHKCPLRAQCLNPRLRHRTILVGEHHSHLQARRLEQKTEAFHEKYMKRAGIEGTHSELKRGHGLGRARYRGQAKVDLQAYLTGAACNIKRWIRRVIWELAHAPQAAPVAVESG